jgi:hypothetical protein
MIEGDGEIDEMVAECIYALMSLNLKSALLDVWMVNGCKSNA